MLFGEDFHMEFHCSHIYRKGNTVVYNLASRAPIICFVTWWWDVISFVNVFVIFNANSGPTYRFS